MDIFQKIIENMTAAPTVGPMNETDKFFYSIFNRSTITIVIWFLAMHFCFVFMTLIYLNRNVNPTLANSSSRILDFGVFSLLLMYFTTSYYANSELYREQMVENVVSSLTSFADTPSSIFILTALIILKYITIYLFGIPMNPENKPFFIAGIENFAWVFLVFIIIVDFFKYVLGYSFIKMLNDYFNWSSLPVDAPGSLFQTLGYDVNKSVEDTGNILKGIAGELDVSASKTKTTLSPGSAAK